MGIEVLAGKTLSRILGEHGDDEIVFYTEDGKTYALMHVQDCCENVRLEEVHGDLSDLVGSPLLQAEEVSSDDAPEPYAGVESYTWTFYKLATNKGAVTLRFLGTSNGYYSESVSFEERG